MKRIGGEIGDGRPGVNWVPPGSVTHRQCELSWIYWITACMLSEGVQKLGFSPCHGILASVS